MKRFFPLLFLLILSCQESPEQKSAVQIDSAFAAQQNVSQSSTQKTDTVKLFSLPPAMDGDLVFQISDHPNAKALQAATGSKYNNIGLVFFRKKDQQYMVIEVLDSTHVVPLTEWAQHGEGNHIALLRLKDANRMLNEKKMKSLKETVKSLRGRKADPYFGWDDATVYSSELIWKTYHAGLNLDLCQPGLLSSFDATKEPFKSNAAKKYGGKIPAGEKAVTPDDLYKSPKLEIIFER